MQIRDAAVFRELLTKKGHGTYGPTIIEALWPETDFRTLYNYIDTLHGTTEQDLTTLDLQLFVETRREDLLPVVESIKESPRINSGVLYKTVQDFVSRHLAFSAATQIVQNYNKDDFDPGEAYGMLQNAVDVRAHTSIDDLVTDYFTADMPDRELDRPNLCNLGLSSKLDDAIGGGVAAGEVCIILAGTKKGKTSILRRIGLHNAMQGKHVLDITIETNKNMIARRYDSAATGLDYQQLCVNPQVVEAARQRIAKEGGSIKLVDWQYQDHSPSELMPLVEQCGQVDLIILDYLQLMVPNRTRNMGRDAQRILYGKLGKDFRAALKQLGIGSVTAWQSNRQGSQADQVSQFDVAECWDIMQHADTVIGLSRSEQERVNGILRIHTILQRFSESQRSVSFRADFERNQLEEIG